MTLDAQILSALRGAGPDSLQPSALAVRFNTTPAVVTERVRELRQLGYEIESTPHLGLRLITSPDVLHADELLSRLTPGQVIGRDVRVFQETSSTNDVVEKLARTSRPTT